MTGRQTKKDYYKILGISESADAEEIKRAYRERARELHPDEDKPTANEARMKEVNEANECLSDPTRRKQYDQERQPSKAESSGTTGAKAEATDSPRSGSGGSKPPPRSPTRPRSPATMPNRAPHSPISEADVVLPLDAYPPIDWGASAGRVGALAGSLALLASPFFIMSATGAASDDHLSGSWAIELGCFALFVVGLVAVGCVLASVFSRD
jgi:curved DNA-binding protein CbpA